VEFALLVPLMFLIFINTVNFAGFFFAWITVANAARAGGDYWITGSITINGPTLPTPAQVAELVTAEVSSLLNRDSLVLRVCTRTPADSATASCVNAVGSGTFSDPPPDDTGARPEASLYTMGWIDVLYTYEPLIPVGGLPSIGINLTLPPLTLHRRAVMRVLN
jgi:hypothetical protein